MSGGFGIHTHELWTALSSGLFYENIDAMWATDDQKKKWNCHSTLKPADNKILEIWTAKNEWSKIKIKNAIQQKICWTINFGKSIRQCNINLQTWHCLIMGHGISGVNHPIRSEICFTDKKMHGGINHGPKKDKLLGAHMTSEWFKTGSYDLFRAEMMGWQHYRKREMSRNQVLERLKEKPPSGYSSGYSKTETRHHAPYIIGRL